MSAVTRDQVIGFIGDLRVAELSEFIEELKTKLNIKEVAYAAPVAAGGAAPAAEAVEEKSEFELFMTAAGSNKVGVIKIMRVLFPTLSLVDAKKQIDEATGPILMKKGSKDEVNKFKAELEALGATVEVK
jgi:large subunit ribosomal protein L7/L12